MMDFDFDSMVAAATATLTVFGLKILGAIVAWIVGRWLIRLAIRMTLHALARAHVDATLHRYAEHILNVVLTIALVIAILGYFGVETTSFAALIAGVGIAVGAAWSGLLSNFAAGALLIVQRPFSVGDFVKAGGIEGTVKAIGMFATTIMTPDNVTSFVGNAKITSDTIQNYSLSPWRRVESTAQLAHTVNTREAIHRLRQAVARIPNVQHDPPPDIEIATFNARGPVLAVRPYTHTSHYWQVYFDTNRAIAETFGAAGYPVPEEHIQMRNAS
jgi:small conductance mechanosensitive channel